MGISLDESVQGFIHNLCEKLVDNNRIPMEYYDLYSVKRGLRNADGTGVVAGITKVCNVHGYLVSEGERIPHEGELTYRGYNVEALVKGFQDENRFGYEETAFLLLFGFLPTQAELDAFMGILESLNELPDGFVEDVVMRAPSRDLMNKLAGGVLALANYSDEPDRQDLDHVMLQSMELIARMPAIATAAYHVKRRVFDKKSMFFHNPKSGMHIAENILRMLRSDKKFTDAEAKLLDLCLILHMEHGGGNNSTFVARMLTSAGSDTYSSMSAAIGSLKGSRHGGANAKVTQMLDDIKANVEDWSNDDAVASYLEKIVRKQAGDRSGLIYGMGHAVYTLSDPRAIMLKQSAKKLAAENGFLKEFELIESVERLTPAVFAAVKGDRKVVSANVDLYSGFVYKMLGIPTELCTPMFAIARIVGWSAHRIEELVTCGRIMRPAYKSIAENGVYIPISQRG